MAKLEYLGALMANGSADSYYLEYPDTESQKERTKNHAPSLPARNLKEK
jgi:hypothetical protein